MINEKTIKRLKQLNKADFVNAEARRWTDKQVLDIVQHYSVKLAIRMVRYNGK